MSPDLRFAPPDLPRPAGFGWVLRRAFGPVDATLHGGSPGAAELAVRLDLAARIASRVRRSVLVEEVGQEAARRLASSAAACAAQALRLEGALRVVSAAAARSQVAVVWLKYAALERSGRLRPGSRFASDVDVLAPADLANHLQAALVVGGFVAADHGHEHQLPALAHAEHGAVEVHRVVLGLRLHGGRRSAGFAELRDSGKLLPSSEDQGSVFVPAPEVLAAHAVAHGLGQHVFAPRSYSPFRMLADLADLEFGSAIPADAVSGWLERGVPRAEVEALAALCRALAAGEVPEQGPPGLLLRHFLAGMFSDDYARSLKVDRLARPFSDAPRAVALGNAAVRALWPSAQDMAVIYGPTRSAARRFLQRLWRPIDLGWRLAAGWRARRLTRR